MARFRHSTAFGGRWCILLVVLCALRAYPIPRLLDAPSPCGGRLPPSLSFRRAPDGSHAACREHAQGPDPVRRLVLRGGGRKLKPKKKSRGGRGAKLRQSHWTTSGLLDTDADSHSNEGPAVSPAGSERQKPRTNELESMIQAATEIASNEEEEDVEEVGLPYQQCTPLTRGHKDIQQPRDAQSYCAEAARCLGRFEIEDAEACYQEALKLQPDAPWILNAYGSLLADQGRVEDAVDIFNKSISIDVNNSHVPHLYLGQVMDGQESLSYMRTGVAILEKAEQDCAARQDARAAGAPAPSPDAEPSRDGGPMPMESKAITAALCSARCALGEALLAEDDTGAADEEAEALFRAAMLARPDAPDAHQGLASLRLSQERPQEAGAYMQSVLGILAETRLECLPSIDFRLQSAKLLIELGLAADAVKVLRRVQKEKDYLAELWYLMAFAYRLLGDEAAVHEAALRGLQHLRKVGGAEQARHPVTGEVLTTDDFRDIMGGYQVADRDVDALQAQDAADDEAGKAQALTLATLDNARAGSALPDHELQQLEQAVAMDADEYEHSEASDGDSMSR